MRKLNERILNHTFKLPKNNGEASFRYTPFYNNGTPAYEVSELNLTVDGKVITDMKVMQEALLEFIQLESMYYADNV